MDNKTSEDIEIAFAELGKAVSVGGLADWPVRLLHEAFKALTADRDEWKRRESFAVSDLQRQLRELQDTPAALVDDATTFAAFDAASNTYDASIKIRGDSHKRALLEACRAYTAALSAKGDGQ